MGTVEFKNKCSFYFPADSMLVIAYAELNMDMTVRKDDPVKT